MNFRARLLQGSAQNGTFSAMKVLSVGLLANDDASRFADVLQAAMLKSRAKS